MTVKLGNIKIGTRGSPLALMQTGMVRDALLVVQPDLDVEVIIIKTSGDWAPADGEVRLNVDEGGKGQFAKEIEEAMLADAIDIAVHSMKDMETFLPDGLIIPCMLPREDARDALLVHKSLGKIGCVNDLPQGAVVGTASVRRQAFLLAQRPDLKIVPFRGNVQTRIDKLRDAQVDVTMLAMAGLSRLGLSHEMDAVLDIDKMLPSAGQGAVGVEVKHSNINAIALISQLNCEQTLLRVSAERAALSVLDGSCHTPIGAHAILDGGEMFLRVCVASLDGSEIYDDEEREAVGSVPDAEAFGRRIAERLKSVMPEGILEQVVDA